MFIACTNNLQGLDAAFTNRMKRTIQFSLPTEDDRKDIFQRFGSHLNDEELTNCAKSSEGMSGRDIASVYENAAFTRKQIIVNEARDSGDDLQELLDTKPDSFFSPTEDDFIQSIESRKSSYMMNTNEGLAAQQAGGYGGGNRQFKGLGGDGQQEKMKEMLKSMMSSSQNAATTPLKEGLADDCAAVTDTKQDSKQIISDQDADLEEDSSELNESGHNDEALANLEEVNDQKIPDDKDNDEGHAPLDEVESD
eukprot:GHVH01005257.1.p2 GENE.GHVH01005257.1~~GHVH01005257.1.p2  ORF type:complete len:252 (+),score=58.78 GHVH01005257.1:1510-2265(+)